MQKLRQAQGENALFEQLDTALAFAATPAEQLQAAFELIHNHGQCRTQTLPGWLEHALS